MLRLYKNGLIPLVSRFTLNLWRLRLFRVCFDLFLYYVKPNKTSIFFVFESTTISLHLYSLNWFFNRTNPLFTLLLSSVMGLLPVYFVWNVLFYADSRFDTFQSYCIPGAVDNDFFASLSFDGVSILFVLLLLFVFPLCYFSVSFYYPVINRFFFIILLFVLEIILLGVFLFTNMLVFYIFFEATLIPMFLLIGYFGSRFRKVKAAYYLFFYTFLGSVFMLIGLISIFTVVGSMSLQASINYTYSDFTQKTIWIFFFITFAVKIPMVPFHIWLPEAHVEAPTIGSIILASVLLKLGGYGFYRFLLGIFWDASIYFSPLVHLLAIGGVIFASLSTLRQLDIKRVVAYSSIAHMNLAVLGLFSGYWFGTFGAIYLMFGHGLISAGLFFSIGVLYDRYHTRLILYYGGLVVVMPLYALCVIFLLFANVGFPGTVNFISEFYILLNLAIFNPIELFFLFIGFVLTVIYCIWLFNRVFFGTLKTHYISHFSDINGFEFGVLFIISFFGIFFGLSSALISYFV